MCDKQEQCVWGGKKTKRCCLTPTLSLESVGLLWTAALPQLLLELQAEDNKTTLWI